MSDEKTRALEDYIEAGEAWVVPHVFGCGGPGIIVTTAPYDGMPLNARNAFLLDGARPRPGDFLDCGTCGQNMAAPRASDCFQIESLEQWANWPKVGSSREEDNG